MYGWANCTTHTIQGLTTEGTITIRRSSFAISLLSEVFERASRTKIPTTMGTIEGNNTGPVGYAVKTKGNNGSSVGGYC